MRTQYCWLSFLRHFCLQLRFLLFPSFFFSRSGCVRRCSASSSYSWGIFIKLSLNFLKIEPCLGLVRTSHHMLRVGLYLIPTSPNSTLPFHSELVCLMCFIFFELEILPFVARRIVDVLSWRRTLWPIL